MRLLLDIHIDPRVGQRLAGENVDVISLREWKGGDFRRSLDELILSEAHADGRVFVTYDQRTIPGMVTAWKNVGRAHAGVVLIDELTIRSTDIGGLIRAIRAFIAEEGDADWTNRVDYLRRAREE